MKTLSLIVLTFFVTGLSLSAQKIYNTSSLEMFFSKGTVEFTDKYLQDNPGSEALGVPLRYTVFLNVTNHWHMDFTNNIGLYTGLGLRNTGLISDEKLLIVNQQDPQGPKILQDFKIVRRLYTVGIPLALKLGSFKDHLHFYGGAEAEFAIAFKEKYWNSNSRSESKTKYTEWFGNQTPDFLPSLIVGAQLPKGLNIQFKYYLDNFFDNTYTNSNTVSDLTRYKTSEVWYVSVSWQFNTAYLKNKSWQDDENDVARIK